MDDLRVVFDFVGAERQQRRALDAGLSGDRRLQPDAVVEKSREHLLIHP